MGKTKGGKANAGNGLKGAEAVITHIDFAGIEAIVKERKQKKYRPAVLDAKIRATRTKIEARLLHKAKLARVPCPHVLEVLPYSITMTKENGKMLHKMGKIGGTALKQAGIYLARLHNAGIIHGDYTPANLMLHDADGQLVVIDFGLGGISHDGEDFAVDVITMKKALKSEGGRKAFFGGYSAEEKKLGAKKSVLRLIDEIEKRARYQERGE